MGNRGTTPSWDDEQIRDYGLAMHWASVARRFHPHPTLTQRREELGVLLQRLLESREKDMRSTEGESVVHGLCGGFPLCSFTQAVPRDWPEGNTFVPYYEPQHITCPACQEEAKKFKPREVTNAS